MDARRNWAAAAALLILGAAGVQADDARWGDPCRSADAERSARIGAVYEARDRSPVWVKRGGLTAAGARLVELLERAESGSREAGDFVTDCLEEALDGSNERFSRGQTEVMLTDAYLVLAADRLPDRRSVRSLLEPLASGESGHSIDERLDRLTGAPERVIGDRSDAERLAAALARYRSIRDEGGWPEIAAGPVLEPGDRDQRVPALRERLAISGDLAGGAQGPGSQVYDDRLVRAVRAFQRRHGLTADGTVDERTRHALSIPAAARAEQLRRNLERVRRHETDTEGDLVRVNIPAFRLELRRNGRPVYETRVIVGRPDRQTPVLDGRITRLTLNPAWNVPASIVRNDLAPRFARNPDYAERQGFRLASGTRRIGEVDWRSAPAEGIRQEPGPRNALGRIKFNMPNRRAIFLHDTPHRHLFTARKRAFSSGCVRVEDPLELASRLAGYGESGPDRLAAAIDTEETRSIRFGRTIPVQLVYFTAWVDREGQVQFREDIYGKDGPEVAVLDRE